MHVLKVLSLFHLQINLQLLMLGHLFIFQLLVVELLFPQFFVEIFHGPHVYSPAGLLTYKPCRAGAIGVLYLLFSFIFVLNLLKD